MAGRGALSLCDLSLCSPRLLSVKWAQGLSPRGSHGAKCPCPRDGMEEGLGPSQRCVCEDPRTRVGGSGEPGPWHRHDSCPPFLRLQWVPGRRALGWASGCPLSWWSPARWVLWRVGSCVGPQRASGGVSPRPRLLLVSEGCLWGLPKERSRKQGLLPALPCKQGPPALQPAHPAHPPCKPLLGARTAWP